MTSRPDVVSAMVSARAQGSPVEAVDERTEFSSTWANPDGTLTTRRHYGQQRFKDAHGRWVEVNLSLRPGSDGSLTAQIPGGLSVAGPSADATGGHGDALVVTGKGTSREVTFAAPTGWTRKAATASGVTASMPGVAPGTSMSVQARRTGFESLVSLANASAVAGAVATSGPAAGRVAVSFPIRTRGLTVKAEGDGSVSFSDAKGTVVSRIVPPQALSIGRGPVLRRR